MNFQLTDAQSASAYGLKQAIEYQSDPSIIGQQTQQLVWSLGGFANVDQMTPGAAALYIVALVLSQPRPA